MADLIQPYSRRPARHPDGIVDLELGVWLLAFALMTRLTEGTFVTMRWLAITYGVIAVAWAIDHFGIRVIRARLVYRRSGYVRTRQRPWMMALVAVLGAIIAAAIGLYFVKAGTDVLSPPLIAALLFGLMLLVGAVGLHSRRYIGYSVLSMTIGVVLQLLEPGLVAGAAWYFLLMGMAVLIGGAITLYLFVRHTPPQDLEAE